MRTNLLLLNRNLLIYLLKIPHTGLKKKISLLFRMFSRGKVPLLCLMKDNFFLAM